MCLKPNYPEALNNLSETLMALGLPDDALKAADDALRLKSDYAEAWSNRGAALIVLRQPQAALDALNHALEMRPALQKALANRGSILMGLNRFAEALADFDHALALAPDEPLMQWNLSMCQLLTGDFAAGWSRYGARWSMALKGLHPKFRQPQWDGMPTDQRVLVWGEQGPDF